jgi:hypothetical protein
MGDALCGPFVDQEVSDVSAHLRRERIQPLPMSLLSQLRALPQFWGSKGSQIPAIDVRLVRKWLWIRKNLFEIELSL